MICFGSWISEICGCFFLYDVRMTPDRIANTSSVIRAREKLGLKQQSPIGVVRCKRYSLQFIGIHKIYGTGAFEK